MKGTIREAVEAFRLYFEDMSGRPSDDFSYPPKLIYYYLNLFRNAVTYEDRMRKSANNVDESIIMTLPCVELTKVDVVECPCAPASGCKFLKSKFKIPKLLDGLPLSVVTLGSECDNCDPTIQEFDYVPWSNFQYKLTSRLSAQKTGLYYTMKNIDSEYHLYIYTNSKYKDLKAVTLRGIFKNPIEVAEFPICNEIEKVICNPLDMTFIIEEELQPKVYEQVYLMLTRYKQATPTSDVLNNDNNDNASKVPV